MRIGFVLLAIAPLLAACNGSSTSSPTVDMTAPLVEDFTFPASFVFGSAIAGFQVEAGCPTIDPAECEDRHVDWYHFVSTPELQAKGALALSGDPVSDGPGFYELYPQDIQRAADELENGGLRLSIEWSRVFPTATFGVTGHDELKKMANPKALAFYHAVLAELAKRKMKPLVTLHHYSLPDWMHDTVACHRDLATCTARGWVDARIVPEMAKWAGFAAQEFGGEVDTWATLNEPLTAVVLAGFIFPSKARSNPPGTTLKTVEGKQAMVAMIEAHARMYDAVKAADTKDADGDGAAARVGIVYNLQATRAVNPADPVDVTAVANAGYLMNQAFLDGVILGKLDANLDKKIVERDDLKNRMDYLGVNYYARIIVQGTPTAFLPAISPLTTFNLLALEYDYADPRGIYEVLLWAKQRYGKPMIITETGAEDPRDDGTSARWLVQTLAWTKRAMNEGATVEGYYYWTLIDNYEWNHGMDVRLGLYAVSEDDKTKARKARSSVPVYAEIATARAVTKGLLERFPTPR